MQGENIPWEPKEEYDMINKVVSCSQSMRQIFPSMSKMTRLPYIRSETLIEMTLASPGECSFRWIPKEVDQQFEENWFEDDHSLYVRRKGTDSLTMKFAFAPRRTTVLTSKIYLSFATKGDWYRFYEILDAAASMMFINHEESSFFCRLEHDRYYFFVFDSSYFGFAHNFLQREPLGVCQMAYDMQEDRLLMTTRARHDLLRRILRVNPSAKSLSGSRKLIPRLSKCGFSFQVESDESLDDLPCEVRQNMVQDLPKEKEQPDLDDFGFSFIDV